MDVEHIKVMLKKKQSGGHGVSSVFFIPPLV